MDITKIVMAIVAIGLATTLILPDRQTPRVIEAAANGGSKFLGTAMGTNR